MDQGDPESDSLINWEWEGDSYQVRRKREGNNVLELLGWGREKKKGLLFLT